MIHLTGQYLLKHVLPAISTTELTEPLSLNIFQNFFRGMHVRASPHLDEDGTEVPSMAVLLISGLTQPLLSHSLGVHIALLRHWAA